MKFDLSNKMTIFEQQVMKDFVLLMPLSLNKLAHLETINPAIQLFIYMMQLIALAWWFTIHYQKFKDKILQVSWIKKRPYLFLTIGITLSLAVVSVLGYYIASIIIS